MRNVFTVFLGLVLLCMLAACSNDSTPTRPKPAADFEITTTAVPVGYTCSPYEVVMGVRGGTAPYTWTLADGSDPFPEGLVLTAEGKLSGVVSSPGDFSFTVRCTDSSPTPRSVEKAFDMSVDVPSNPSLAIFFDDHATLCSSGAAAGTPLDCYVFIMLEGSQMNCSQGCEFKLEMTDIDGADLVAGSQYAFDNVHVPVYAEKVGDLVSGITVGFDGPMNGPGPIQAASFELLLLLADPQDLSFKFAPNTGGSLGIATCESGHPVVSVTGRAAAVSYDATPPNPPPPIEITTAAIPVAYTCAPYNVTIGVQGGTTPYTWTLASGSDPLPQGIVLTADGKLSGVVLSPGDFSFTVRCTDSSPTPKWVEKTYTMNVEVPVNPSIAIYYDDGATVCSSTTSAFTDIDCYVFIMLDAGAGDDRCAQACEFKLRLTDANNVDLEPGNQFIYLAQSFPDFVALQTGDLFSGIAMTFSIPQFGSIQVASFKLRLQENISDLSFKFDANPNGTLSIASCAEGFPLVPVTGRVSALNY